MSFFSIDVESDGPEPVNSSMIQLGAVLVDPDRKLNNTFYCELRPHSDNYIQEALDVVGVTRQQTLEYPLPEIGMCDFVNWVVKNNVGKRAMFLSDNAGFDWMFVCSYIHTYTGYTNPFGYSSMSLTSLYKGFVRDTRKSFKHLRKTKHDHNPVNDAMGNAESLLAMIDMGLKCKI